MSNEENGNERHSKHPNSGFRHWFLNGIALGGVITALLGVGRASSTLDTAVTKNEKQDVRIEQLFSQNNKLLIALTEQNIQQKESDKRFEEKFDKTIETLEDVEEGVRNNSKDIIILQQKVSLITDNTGVFLAMAVPYESARN